VVMHGRGMEMMRFPHSFAMFPTGAWDEFG